MGFNRNILHIREVAPNVVRMEVVAMEDGTNSIELYRGEKANELPRYWATLDNLTPPECEYVQRIMSAVTKHRFVCCSRLESGGMMRLVFARSDDPDGQIALKNILSGRFPVPSVMH